MDLVRDGLMGCVAPRLVVDNTHVMTPESPGYSPEDVIVMTQSEAAQDLGWNEFRISLSEHFGTHLDAPSHLRRVGLYSVDQIPGSDLIGPAVVIDVREQAMRDSDYRLAVEDLVSWEEKYGAIPANAIVLMFSGWHFRWSDPCSYKSIIDGVYHFPGFSSAAAEWLLENRKINGIGVDTLSIDHGPSVDYSVHQLILGANKWAVENLNNLHQVPPHGALMIVGPLKHAGGSGGPARVFALGGH